VTLFLLMIVTGLLCGGVATQYLRHVHGHDTQWGFVRLLDLDGENNLPSWYSSILLFFSSSALAIIGLHHRWAKKSYGWHWLALAAIFICLSVDEAASVHEMMGVLIDRWLVSMGYRSVETPWLLAGVPLVVIAFLALWPFAQHLPIRTKRLFFIAGGLYVGGAIGIEAMEGIAFAYHRSMLIDSLTVAVEEGLEMVGVIVFLHALMMYMGTQAIRFEVVIAGCFPAADRSHSTLSS
jgi:hypothetical protein